MVGLVLVGLGVVFLLDTADVLKAGSTVADWWPTVIIAAGVITFARDKRSVVVALLLISVGLVLLGVRLGVFDSSVWRYAWPVGLVLVGLAVLFGRGRRTPLRDHVDRVNEVAVLSGREVHVSSQSFTGGDATIVLGSLEIDLSKAKLQPGATLNATVLLGALDVVVPEGWRIDFSGTPILGGWDDTTRRDLPDNPPSLKISSVTILSGIEVRHAKRWG